MDHGKLSVKPQGCWLLVAGCRLIIARSSPLLLQEHASSKLQGAQQTFMR